MRSFIIAATNDPSAPPRFAVACTAAGRDGRTPSACARTLDSAPDETGRSSLAHKCDRAKGALVSSWGTLDGEEEGADKLPPSREALHAAHEDEQQRRHPAKVAEHVVRSAPATGLR